jgi:hypothetical protein
MSVVELGVRKTRGPYFREKKGGIGGKNHDKSVRYRVGGARVCGEPIFVCSRRVIQSHRLMPAFLGRKHSA